MTRGNRPVEEVVVREVVLEADTVIAERVFIRTALSARRRDLEETVLAVRRADLTAAARLDVGTVDAGAVRTRAVGDAGDLIQEGVARAGTEGAHEILGRFLIIARRRRNIAFTSGEDRAETLGAQTGVEAAVVVQRT
ncbi:hypothetical protein D3C80_1651100 [compost metagenome]